MKLTIDQVKHVAKLANLPIKEAELEKYSEQLSEVLEYIEVLNSVDTKDIEPTFNVTGLEDVLRDDLSLPGLTQDEAIQNAPNTKDGFIVTKGVFEEDN